MVEFKCRICREHIQEPMEIEIDEGICMRCFEELAEDVDESSRQADEFMQADLDNKEMRFDVQEKERC